MQSNGSALNGSAIGGERKRGGPQTAAGKARSRQNGVRHGGRTVLPVVEALGERAEDFEALREALVAELAPGHGTPLVKLLVERAARLWWRLHRVERAEALLLEKSATEAETDALATLEPSDPFDSTDLSLRTVRRDAKLREMREDVAELEAEYAASSAVVRAAPGEAVADDVAERILWTILDDLPKGAQPELERELPSRPRNGWTRRTLAKRIEAWVGPYDDDPDDLGEPMTWLGRVAILDAIKLGELRGKIATVEAVAERFRPGRTMLNEARAERIGREERRLSRELERTLEQIRAWRGGA